MAGDSPPPPQQGCGVVNLLLPLFVVGGAVAGWAVGRPYGVAAGVGGAVVGLVLGVPALGLVLLAILGVIAAAQWCGLVGRDPRP